MPKTHRASANCWTTLGKVDPRDLIPEGSYATDPLAGIGKEQHTLLKSGQVVWGALIQANSQLFRPFSTTLPGEVVIGFDSRITGQPSIIEECAQRIFAIKGTQPSDPELREVADRITYETHRSLGERLPNTITAGWELYRYTILFHTPHLPGRFLNGRLLPMLARRKSPHAIMIPSHYWPDELLEEWSPSEEQRSAFAKLEIERQNKPAIQLTPAAIAILKKLIEEHQQPGEELHVRLTVDEKGVDLCLDPHTTAQDKQFTFGGVKVLIDASTAEHYRGATIDFTTAFSVNW